jgi:hypothetical protein
MKRFLLILGLTVAASSAHAQSKQDFVQAWYWAHNYHINVLRTLLTKNIAPVSCHADAAAAARVRYPFNPYIQTWFVSYVDGLGTEISGNLLALTKRYKGKELERQGWAYLHKLEQQKCGFEDL